MSGDKPVDRPVPTPGAGFYDPKKETPQRLVEEGKGPQPRAGGDRLTDAPLGIGVNMPAPGDRLTQ